MDMMQDRMGGPSEASEPMSEERMESPEEERQEKSSVFLSKADLGDHKCKVGDIIKLKVTDIDPETGDVQADIEDYGDEKQSSAMDDFDKAMPAEEKGGY